MRDAADMPELHDDGPALGVNGVGDAPPTRDLLVAVDARCVEIPLAFGADLRGLGDDEAGGSPLRVVLDHEDGRSLPRAGPIARQRCHDDSVAKHQVAGTVSYTHLRAHETDSYLVCRLLLE